MPNNRGERINQSKDHADEIALLYAFNNLAVIEKFAQLIQKYGLAKVRSANAETAKLRLNNAKRNIDNTILLLKG